MVSWLLNLVWMTLLAALSPWLVYRRFVQRKSIGDWGQKLLGRVPVRTGAHRCVWLHAVSVGEVLQLPQIVAELKRRDPRMEIVISATTTTGFGVARQKFPNAIVAYWPLDFSWAISAAFSRLRPNLVVLVELELWPNFLRVARQRQIPVALVNGRITERSVRGYRRIGPIIRWMLSRLEWIAVQNAVYARRFEELGAPTERIQITGSVKFDGVETERDNPRTGRFRELLGLQSHPPVFLAGSTHAPEERIAVRAWQSAQKEFPTLRLVLAPRHAERFDEVARLVREELGVPLIRRSALTDANSGDTSESSHKVDDSKVPAVILLDSLGELSACWGLADVAFVGGSLTDRGGQSMIEPAAFGAALLFGPNTWNFADVVSSLLDREAAEVVTDGNALALRIVECLNDPVAAAERGSRARELVLESQGATSRTVTGIINILDERADAESDHSETRRRAAA
ncbi:MAG: 3-deoxy-D-manno-octulosonic acid transferase [Planctomycetota bacterium]|nr:3-deoxy-D-manno-octulosonic acid transferase [Planctomycetota bacterium]